MIGNLDINLMVEFLDKVKEATGAARKVRITTPGGMDIEFENEPGRFFSVHNGLIVRPGQIACLPGQISWVPKFGTINGKMVFDAAIDPGISDLDTPVTAYIEKDFIVKIEGGTAAREWESWLKHFEDPNMFRVAHCSYGLNPGATLSRIIAEDERVWGGVEFGFGNIGDYLIPDYVAQGKYMRAISHCDGMASKATVLLDGKYFFKDGEVVGPTPEIIELAKRLRESNK